jgi:hypothetical protein
MKVSMYKDAVERNDLAGLWEVKTMAGVCALLAFCAICALCSLTLLTSSGRFAGSAAGREQGAPVLARQIAGADMLIPSPALSSIGQTMLRRIQKLETDDPAADSRTNVNPLKTAPARQAYLSENKPPKGRLPP